MNSRKLTKEEIKFIEKIVRELLKPISGKIKINFSSVFQCSRGNIYNTNINTGNCYAYRVKFDSNRGSFEDTEFFHNVDLLDIAWHLAHKAFKRLDGDLFGPLAENLWPKREILEEYKKFLDK